MIAEAPGEEPLPDEAADVGWRAEFLPTPEDPLDPSRPQEPVVPVDMADGKGGTSRRKRVGVGVPLEGGTPPEREARHTPGSRRGSIARSASGPRGSLASGEPDPSSVEEAGGLLRRPSVGPCSESDSEGGGLPPLYAEPLPANPQPRRPARLARSDLDDEEEEEEEEAFWARAKVKEKAEEEADEEARSHASARAEVGEARPADGYPSEEAVHREEGEGDEASARGGGAQEEEDEEVEDEKGPEVALRGARAAASHRLPPSRTTRLTETGTSMALAAPKRLPPKPLPYSHVGPTMDTQPGDDFSEPYGFFNIDTWFRKGMEGPLNKLRSLETGLATSMRGVPTQQRAALYRQLVHKSDHRPLLHRLMNGEPRTVYEGQLHKQKPPDFSASGSFRKGFSKVSQARKLLLGPARGVGTRVSAGS